MKPSGPLDAPLTCMWHYPTFSTKKPSYGMVMDTTNPSLRVQGAKLSSTARSGPRTGSQFANSTTRTMDADATHWMRCGRVCKSSTPSERPEQGYNPFWEGELYNGCLSSYRHRQQRCRVVKVNITIPGIRLYVEGLHLVIVRATLCLAPVPRYSRTLTARRLDSWMLRNTSTFIWPLLVSQMLQRIYHGEYGAW